VARVHGRTVILSRHDPNNHDTQAGECTLQAIADGGRGRRRRRAGKLQATVLQNSRRCTGGPTNIWLHSRGHQSSPGGHLCQVPFAADDGPNGGNMPPIQNTTVKIGPMGACLDMLCFGACKEAGCTYKHPTTQISFDPVQAARAATKLKMGYAAYGRANGRM
jgi:hypothetical protein